MIQKTKPFACHFKFDIKKINSHIVLLSNNTAEKPDKTLVFLHGWGGSYESFWQLSQSILTEKYAKNWQILLLDFPGFGDSQNPPTSGWSTHDYADWLEGVINKMSLQKKDILFYTHSFGGRILVRWIGKYGQKFPGKIVITSSAGIKFELSFLQKLSIMLSKKTSLAKKILPQKLQKFVITKILKARDWGIVKKELKPTLIKVLAESDFRNELKKIENKTLIIWGDKDQITPLQAGKIFHQNIKNSQLLILKNARHGVHRTHQLVITNELNKFFTNPK